MKGVVMAKKFVTVTGQAAKLKNFRHETNGLKPFFVGLRFPKAEADKLTYLLEEGMMCRVTIAQTEKSLFADDDRPGEE